MKTTAILILTLSFALGSLHAQTVPLIINYQGEVTGGTGTPLGSTGTAPNFIAAPENRKVIFRIFDAQTGGTRLWSEQQTATISLGEFSVLLGQGIDAVYDAVTESRPALDTVFTGGGAVPPAGPVRYLEIVVDDGNGTFTSGADVPITPRQRITTSAYSFRSRIADSVPNQAIATQALADGAVISVKIADNSITSLKLFDGSVTTEKIADNQITTAKIADSSISAAKLDPAIGIWSANAGNVSRLTGNVGIGKLPVVPLDVVGDITATGAVTAGSFTTAGAINAGGPFTATTITANAGVRIPGSNILQFGFGVPGRDASAGQIGYGTHSAGAALDFVGAGTTAANRKIHMWSEGGALLYGGLHSTGYLSSNGYVYAGNYVLAAGNVVALANGGFGTDAPQDRVHLLGAVRMDNGAGRYVRMSRSTSGLVIEANSTSFAGYSAIQWDGDNNWDTYSDQTLKKDITDAEPVLESLMKLPVRRYQWKDRPMKERKCFGVIAQEVKPLFPDVVGSMVIEGKAKQVMSVKYGAFGLIAAKAVQELKREKDAEVKALQEENASLRNRLSALEARDKARETSDKARDAKLAEIETLLLSGGKTATRAASLKAGE